MTSEHPEPIPDQVLTPHFHNFIRLTMPIDRCDCGALVLNGNAYVMLGTERFEEKAREAVEAAIRQRTIEQLRPFTTHREGCNDPSGCTCGFAAALAGVPKEAGE